jgi:hypothetical protein
LSRARSVFDFIAGGAGTEHARRRTPQAFADTLFRNLGWPGSDEALLRTASALRMPCGLSASGSTTIERAAAPIPEIQK